MAHHKDHPCCVTAGDHGFGFLQGHSDGLLTEDMFASTGGVDRLLSMSEGRRANQHSADRPMIYERVKVRHHRSPVLRCEPCGPLPVNIPNSDNGHAPVPKVLGMNMRDASSSNDADQL